MEWRPLSEYPTPDKYEYYGITVLFNDGKECYIGYGAYDIYSDDHDDGTPVFEKWRIYGDHEHEIKLLVWMPLPEYNGL